MTLDGAILVVKKASVAVILTFPLTQFRLSNDEVLLVWLLAIAIVLDSVLGTFNAIVKKRFASWNFGQPLATKVARYGFALTAAFIASKTHIALYWSMEYLAIYFTLSEVLSIFEKLSLLGQPIPTALLSKVNDLFSRYQRGEQGAEKAILNKEN